MTDFLMFLLTPFSMVCMGVLVVSVCMGIREEKRWNAIERDDPTYGMTDEERREFMGIRIKK